MGKEVHKAGPNYPAGGIELLLSRHLHLDIATSTHQTDTFSFGAISSSVS